MYKTETPNWHQNMAERHAEKLADENAALREALRLKEAECEVLEGDKSELLLSLNETVRALADICGANGIKGEDDFICEIEEFIVEMTTNEKQTSAADVNGGYTY